eukprot:CAMPEP_0204601180 /NCGR_PEP_ID=MMETSP0661-20131031/55879_1 /ASSEMBLY_ACC=CAM_ASM_000606 /TAXON_ID=109239 /ORGANISM="Alexandrium margalefi, Strain AMGDE01CS-322" /LENGTH=33 /DNA_ID= /DNA_START= /DNA_END= /DNA_ORIENTATION=
MDWVGEVASDVGVKAMPDLFELLASAVPEIYED